MLTALILIPFLGALTLAPMSESTPLQISRVKRVALLTTVVTFILSMIMWGEFDSSSSQYQFTVEYNQLSYLHMHMGVDGLSLYFVLLTTFTMPICILASWENVKHNIKSYMIAFLVLESLLIAVFVVLDLLLFYVFFESVLIPLFIIVGVWGASADRIRASFQRLIERSLSLVAID